MNMDQDDTSDTDSPPADANQDLTRKLMAVKTVRIPIFEEKESLALLELVEQHKNVIMCPMRTGEICKLKDQAWNIICNDYNRKGFKIYRSPFHLRVKWENLKKIVRKKTNQLEDGYAELEDRVHGRVLDMLLRHSSDMTEDAASNGSAIKTEQTSQEQNMRRFRSNTFSAVECNTLLQCVKAESQSLFSLQKSLNWQQERKLAWDRITKAFNSQLPGHRRSAKVLETKFKNMKRQVKSKRSSQDVNLNDTSSDSFQYYVDLPVKQERREVAGAAAAEAAEGPAPAVDPLSSVLNGYTYSDNYPSCGGIVKEDPEVVRLKLELLNYQLETAKLERERVTAAIEAEASYRAQRQRLLDLRLREATVGPPAHFHLP